MFPGSSWKGPLVALPSFLKPCGPEEWTKALTHAGQAQYRWVMTLAVMSLRLPWAREENQGQCDVKEGQRSHRVWGAAEGFMLPRGNSSVMGRQELWNPFLWIYKYFTRVKSGDLPLCYGFLFVFCCRCFEKNQQRLLFLLSILDSLKYPSPPPILKILKITQYFHVWEFAYMNIKGLIKPFSCSVSYKRWDHSGPNIFSWCLSPGLQSESHWRVSSVKMQGGGKEGRMWEECKGLSSDVKRMSHLRQM